MVWEIFYILDIFTLKYGPTSEFFFSDFIHLEPKIGPAVISADFTAGPIKQCAPHFFQKVY